MVDDIVYLLIFANPFIIKKVKINGIRGIRGILCQIKSALNS